MSPRMIFNLLVGLAAIAAIVLVAGPEIGVGGDEEKPERVADAPEPPRDSPPAGATGTEERRAPASPAQERAAPRPEPRKLELPENSDEVKGSQEFSLHRPANLRRALRVLERERRRAEGVFDGLRIAPGRIDTTVNSANRKLHLQIRPDLKISFRTDSEFPNANDPDFRKKGLGAGAVDVTRPSRILRRIDRQRRGSSARDLDYFVIRRDIIDFKVNYGAYLRSGARPRIYLLEPGEPFRTIG